MSIEILNNNIKYFRLKPAVINIQATNGNARIRFSVQAVRLLNLKAGMKICFGYDTRYHDVAYFWIDAKTGIELRKCGGVKYGSALSVNSRPVAVKLAKHFRLNNSSSFTIKNEVTVFNKKKCWIIDRHQPHKSYLKKEK